MHVCKEQEFVVGVLINDGLLVVHADSSQNKKVVAVAYR
jgi:hypothetical protein